jgi:DUF4097 and DUF4098 domain-containing protein YvlB
MNSKTLFTLIVVICFCLPFTYGGCSGSGGSGNNDQVFAEEPFYSEVSVQDHDLLRIEAINGSIEINGSPTANSVTIEGERRVGSSSLADAEEHLAELEVRVTDLGTEVLVETIQPRISRGRNYKVDYRITVPENFEVLANQVNGSVFVDTLDSPVSVNNVNGDIDLVEILGSTHVNVVNGRIISEVTLPINGSIELKTVNGRINSEVRLLSDGTVDITTLQGSINLDIPQDTSATFAAGVINGNIVLSNLVLQDMVRTSQTLTGTLGDGKGDIRLETENGNITVTGF